jgi:hypothetical protein
VPGTGRHYAVWHDPMPKPAYLFALVGGRLDRVAKDFTTMEGRRVEIAVYVEPGKGDRAAYALDAVERSMAWDETAFGRAYDLDVFNVVAVSDFNMGAMENKGLNIFNDKYVLASPETATDADYAAIEAIIAHEYFHNWSGNRVTCRDWFQLCLKEGLTVFRDQEFSSDMRSRAVHRIAEVRNLRARQFPEDAGPLAHPVRPKQYAEINNFYTATVYEKGAEIVRMLRTLIGDAAFRAGMDRYFARERRQGRDRRGFSGGFRGGVGPRPLAFCRVVRAAGDTAGCRFRQLRCVGPDLPPRLPADAARRRGGCPAPRRPRSASDSSAATAPSTQRRASASRPACSCSRRPRMPSPSRMWRPSPFPRCFVPSRRRCAWRLPSTTRLA